jgi:hypothetical protein
VFSRSAHMEAAQLRPKKFQEAETQKESVNVA